MGPPHTCTTPTATAHPAPPVPPAAAVPFSLDAYAPAAIAERIAQAGVVKTALPLRALLMLGLLAGAFIGLGCCLYLLVLADASLPWAVARVLGGVVFSLGLLLVIVAGAELFTGNNLLAMAWAEGRIGTGDVLRNWAWVALANLVGSVLLAVLVFLAQVPELHAGALGRQALRLVAAKQAMPGGVALFKGVLCNVLVCLAVWMAMGGRTLVDKAVAVVPPVTAFVALGAEHCIANLFLFPLALLLQAAGSATVLDETTRAALQAAPLLPGALAVQTLWVVAGNVLGGSVLVGGVYHVIYRSGTGGSRPG
jgi:formate transporter